MLVSLLCCDRA